MANRYIDGFDDYQSADINKYWNAGSGATIVAGGRVGNKCNAVTWPLAKVLDAQSTWIIGAAFRIVNLGTDILRLSNNDGSQVTLQIGHDYKLYLKRGTGFGTQLEVSTKAMQGNTWYYIEFKVTIGNAGSYEARVNGERWLFSAAADTQEQAACSTADMVEIGWEELDDVYINDGTGVVDNDFWGDITVVTKFPTANGDVNDFAPSAGANWECVDESTVDYPDDNTTYVESGTIGHIDLYAMGDLTGYADATHSVMGVQVNVVAKKTDSGVKSMKTQIKQDAVVYDGAEFFPSEASYVGFHTQYGLAPDGTPWTVLKYNAVQMGAKIVS